MDLDLAAVCDAIANDFGELIDATAEKSEQKQQLSKDENSSPLCGLANEAVAAAGGDCGCGPKKA